MSDEWVEVGRCKCGSCLKVPADQIEQVERWRRFYLNGWECPDCMAKSPGRKWVLGRSRAPFVGWDPPIDTVDTERRP